MTDGKAAMADPAQLRLRDYRPVASLSAPGHRVERACAPAIDAHTHLGRWLTGGAGAVPDTARLAGLMDSCNVTAAVNMDGRWGGAGAFPPSACPRMYCGSSIRRMPGR
jgi:hypothetical protein